MSRNFSKDLLNKTRRNGNRADTLFKTFKNHFNQQDLNDIAAYSFFSQMNSAKPPEKFFKPDGICIGELSDGSLLYLPLDHLKRHLSVIGKTRSGKTTLLIVLFLYLFALANSTLIIIDRGDLVAQLINQIDGRLEDVILVRIADTEHPVAINLLQLAHFQPELVIGEIIRILNLVASERLSDRMVLLLRRCLLALLHCPDATLAEIEPFLFNESFRNQVLAKVPDPELVYFWKERYPKDEKIFRSSAEGIITRLEKIIGDPYARRLLCQKQTLIPFNEIVKSGRHYVLLLDLNTEGKVSHLVGDVIARVFLIIIHSLALSRPFYQSKPIFLFLDEVQTYLEPSTLSEILARGAKYGVHLGCVFQFINQLGNFWSAIEGNVGTAFSFTAGADDAQRLARSFPGIDSTEFVELPRFHTLIRVNDDQGTHCFKAKTFLPPSPNGNFQDQIIRIAREKYARPLYEVEAEYQKRREYLRLAKVDQPKGNEGFVESFDSLT